jgi:methyltransferase-like protein
MRDFAPLLTHAAREALLAVAEDVVACEQMLDLLRCRRFRRDVLAVGGASPTRWPESEYLVDLYLAARAAPAEDRDDTFGNDAGQSLTAPTTSLAAALHILYEARPRALAWHDLLDALQARNAAPKDPDRLARSLLACAQSNLAGLHAAPPPAAAVAGDRPVATALARIQARQGALVVSLRHHTARLGPAARKVLALCDGAHHRDALAEAIAPDAAERDEPPQRVVEDILESLKELSLLLDPARR